MAAAGATPDKTSDTWDWVELLWCALTQLHLREKDFWVMTPRKFFLLLSTSAKASAAKSGGGAAKAPEGPSDGLVYIDQIGDV